MGVDDKEVTSGATSPESPISKNEAIKELKSLRDGLGQKVSGPRLGQEAQRVFGEMASEEIAFRQYERHIGPGRNPQKFLDPLCESFGKFGPFKLALEKYIGVGDFVVWDVSITDVMEVLEALRERGIAVQEFRNLTSQAKRLGLFNGKKVIDRRTGESKPVQNLATVREIDEVRTLNVYTGYSEGVEPVDVLRNVLHDLVRYMSETGFDRQTGELPAKNRSAEMKYEYGLPQLDIYLATMDSLLDTIDSLKDIARG
jgi:hypothetical protein